MRKKVIAGLDVGNGYLKGKLEADGHKVTIDMPSAVSYLKLNETHLPEHPDEDYMMDFANHLDAKMDLNGEQMRILFGNRSLDSGEASKEFNLDDETPKSSNILSVELILGSLASGLVKDSWLVNKKLPDLIEADVTVCLALPFDDYTKYRKAYSTQLEGNEYVVTVNNFETQIPVSMRIEKVEVMPEGDAAFQALQKQGPGFMDKAIRMARQNGADIDMAYTGQMLCEAKNAICVDIGEGTVNFPLINNGRINVDASQTLKQGYGTVLQKVVNNNQTALSSRKGLAAYMVDRSQLPSRVKFREKFQKEIDLLVDDMLIDPIMKIYKELFRKNGIKTDVIYVFGGGADAIKDRLYPKLIEVSKSGDGSTLPVLYISSRVSRVLNRNGLFERAKECASA